MGAPSAPLHAATGGTSTRRSASSAADAFAVMTSSSAPVLTWALVKRFHREEFMTRCIPPHSSAAQQLGGVGAERGLTSQPPRALQLALTRGRMLAWTLRGPPPEQRCLSRTAAAIRCIGKLTSSALHL